MESVIQLNHPVIKEKLAVLRSKDTSRASFRITMKELGKLLSYEILRDFVTDQKDIDTPLGKLKEIIFLNYQSLCLYYAPGIF